MTAVSIQIEKSDENTQRYRAMTGAHESTGRTPGEALDALNAELGNSASGSLIVVQQLQSDPFFTEVQYQRMRELLDKHITLTEQEQSELEQLVKDELIASANRAETLANALVR